MFRRSVLIFVAGTALAASSACGQCPGGGQAGGMTGTTAAAVGATADLSPVRVLTGPGSLAFDVMLAQRIAQQRYMLAVQQQQARQERLAARREQAEKKRTQEVERRARAKVASAPQNSVQLVPAASRSLLAIQAARR
jgi:hypothetical protein